MCRNLIIGKLSSKSTGQRRISRTWVATLHSLNEVSQATVAQQHAHFFRWRRLGEARSRQVLGTEKPYDDGIPNGVPKLPNEVTSVDVSWFGTTASD